VKIFHVYFLIPSLFLSVDAWYIGFVAKHPNNKNFLKLTDYSCGENRISPGRARHGQWLETNVANNKNNEAVGWRGNGKQK
jgi:hypothetical protein